MQNTATLKRDQMNASMFRARYCRMIPTASVKVHSPEDIVRGCQLIEAILEKMRRDLTNTAQVASPYATSSGLCHLIEIKMIS